MSTTPSSNTVATLSSILAALRQQDESVMLNAMAREVNSHVFLRANFPGQSKELTSQDMKVLLHRFDTIIQTIRLSELGPEAYRPNNPQDNSGQLVEEAVRRALEPGDQPARRRFADIAR